jgi:poly-gamma-glutamate capsule biosynthesis protein CapA/YwtB (metallophosphatase superfamily)
MTTSASETLTLIAGGDVAPVQGPVDQYPRLIKPVLDSVDYRLAQCERTYSTRGSYPDWLQTPGGEWTRLAPELARVFPEAGIDVVSLASNHAMDWGYEALYDTIELFKSMGIRTVGAGPDRASAHSPVVVEANGVKVAILAYTSVLRDGQAASIGHPGVAAIRAKTLYEPIDYQPGSPPKILSHPHESDLALMEADISEARKVAHSVLISIHWGVRHIPKVIADYQPVIAHRAIDAGADIVIGHHPHVPKAVEVYRGKVCFYSVGNFMTTGRLVTKAKSRQEWNVFWYDPNWDADSSYRFPRHAKNILLPKIVFGKKGVERVGVILGYVNQLAQPLALACDDERFIPALEYLEWVSDQFPHDFSIEGDEVVIA